MCNSSEQSVWWCCRQVGDNANLVAQVRAQGLPCLDATGWNKVQIPINVTSVSLSFFLKEVTSFNRDASVECSTSSTSLSPFNVVTWMNDGGLSQAWGKAAVWDLRCPPRCCFYISKRLPFLGTSLLFLCPAASLIVLQIFLYANFCLLMAPRWK